MMSSHESALGSGGSYWNVEEMLVVSLTERLGPKSEAVQKKIKLPDFCIFISPLSSSLPIPKFFGILLQCKASA